MLSFSQAFSRPYMANMQSTQRNGDAEGMTHAALTKSVATHGYGGEHGEHGGGHEEAHNDFSNAAKASLALSSQRKKGSNEQTEEKDGKKDDELARVEKDPILNRLMSQVFLNEKDESTIQFLQGSTLNLMGHFSEGFSLGALITALLHFQKIRHSENTTGELVPGQILQGRSEDGYYYKVMHKKSKTTNPAGFFGGEGHQASPLDRLLVMKSNKPGFMGYLFSGFTEVAEIDPKHTENGSKYLDVKFRDADNTFYRAKAGPGQPLQIKTNENGQRICRVYQAVQDHSGEVRFQEIETKIVDKPSIDLGYKANRAKQSISTWSLTRLIGRIWCDVTGGGSIEGDVQLKAPLPQPTLGKSTHKLSNLLPFGIDPHEVMSMKKKDTISKFLRYIPSPDRLLGWGIFGGIIAVAVGSFFELGHSGARLPSITFGGGGGSSPASAPPEGHSSSTSKESPSPKGHTDAPAQKIPTPYYESPKPETFLRQTPQIV